MEGLSAELRTSVIVTPPRRTAPHNAGRHARAAAPAVNVLAGTSSLVQALLALSVLKETPEMSWPEFLPKCQEHLDVVLGKIDTHYTDEQLEISLKHECSLSKEHYLWRATTRTGMKSEDDCHRFAHRLAEAREQELWSGSDQGYVDFCRSYFEYHGGGAMPTEEPQAALPPPKPNNNQIAFIAITILGCVAFVMAVYVVLRSLG